MSQDNVERLRAVYAQWERGNFRAGGELFASDVIYEPMAEGRESFVGLEAVANQMREFLSQWSEFRVEAKSFDAVGEAVVVTERQIGKGRSSGVTAEMTDYAVWKFRDGKAAHVRWETDRQAAFEAAGVSD